MSDIDCDYCNDSFETENKLKTHIMLNHRKEARADGFEYNSPVSEGHMNKREPEKGEQFGYR